MTRIVQLAIVLGAISLSGCGGGYSALEPGNAMPPLDVAGWTNGDKPLDLLGKVVVIEAFATW